MDFETFKKTFGKNGGRRYPASEYSDRVINRNRLEDRNYENACKLIEKERRTVLTTINKDIKKLEGELEVRQGLMRTKYDKERLKLLNDFPYKFRSSDDGYMRRLEELGLADNPHHMSASAGTKKPRYPDRVKKVHSAHGRFGGRGDHGGTVSNLTNIVSQSETTDPTPRTQRSASAFENYDFNDAVVSEIKPVLMSNRANRSVIEASKQELYTPRIGSEINRSNSINELRSESSPTTPTKLPALLPTDTIQIRPKDLKLVKLGRQSRSLESSSDQEAASSPASSTESYQIVMPSTQGTQSPVVSNRFNYSPTALKSQSPSLIMPLPLAPNDRLPSMDADNNLDSNLSQLINSEVPISTTSPTRENRHNHASTGRIISHHVHHSSQGHGTKKKSRTNSSIKTQY